jgi:iron-sulfur cluster assembly protein
MSNQSIITLTSAALSHIRKNIAHKHALGFRLAVKKTGCSGYSYLPDIISEGRMDDIQFEQEGVSIFIDKNSQKFLQGTVIDYIDQGLGQTKLLFHNPNAGNLCGCGESFHLEQENTE